LGTKNGKKPMPVIHTAGKQDDKVSFSRQQQSVQSDKTVNQCATDGSVWATGPEGLLGTQYNSKVSAPVVLLQYDGGHIFPSTIPPQIVNFFKDIAGQ
jgi:hypothetical protein